MNNYYKDSLSESILCILYRYLHEFLHHLSFQFWIGGVIALGKFTMLYFLFDTLTGYLGKANPCEQPETQAPWDPGSLGLCDSGTQGPTDW